MFAFSHLVVFQIEGLYDNEGAEHEVGEHRETVGRQVQNLEEGEPMRSYEYKEVKSIRVSS